MITVEKAQNMNGVLIKGDFFDLDRLYFAVMKLTGNHDLEDRCPFTGCEAVCESLLGLCYELRHAWQGDRDIVQVYNGIRNEWFGDDTEGLSPAHDRAEDFEDEDCLDEDDDDDGDDEPFAYGVDPSFSRADFPDANEHNTYFSIQITFPEAVFYALILSDLLKQKDVFFLSRKRMAEEAGMMQELNKEYYMFQAEEDVARLTLFVKQTLHALYRFVGEEQYAGFIGKFEGIKNYSFSCDIKGLNQTMAEYGEKEYEQDDPEILMSALLSFLK